MYIVSEMIFILYGIYDTICGFYISPSPWRGEIKHTTSIFLQKRTNIRTFMPEVGSSWMVKHW